MRKDLVNIALYIDIENFVGFCSKIGLPVDIQPIIEKLIEGGEIVKGGKIIVRRSFGDIHKLSAKKLVKEYDIRKMLQNNLVQHEDVMYQNEYKNSADIRLVIDALEVAHTNKNIDAFAVVAADRDYLPLFAKLSEMGKEIIGIGGNKESTPDLYVRACDSFLYFENICRKATAVNVEIATNDATQCSPEAGIRLLANAMKSMEAEGFSDNLPVGEVLRVISRQNPDFDLPSYGFKSFIELCEAAHQVGVVDLGYVNGNWHHIKFTAVAEIKDEELKPDKSPIVASGFVTQPNQTITDIETIRNWIEYKLTGNRNICVKLPSYEDRNKIYRSMLKCLKKNDSDEIQLAKLADLVYEDLPYSEMLLQPACFKIIYTLYRAGIFVCSQSFNSMNPIIQSLVVYSDDGEAYDDLFVIQLLRQYKRETGKYIDLNVWSELLFGSNHKIDKLNTLAKQL